MSAERKGRADGSGVNSAALRSREYPFAMTRSEVGLCIDGIAMLVRRDSREAAPLLRRLQALYVTSKELEPDAQA